VAYAPEASHSATEIASQPACWASAAWLAPQVSALLPVPGERVAVVGCGTSYNMALAYAALREAAGHGLSDAWPASEVDHRRGYDRYLFLSRSGTTSEVLAAVEEMPPGSEATGLTADPTSPLAQAVSTVDLSFAAEQSVVQTRFATSVLALLRAHLGELTPVSAHDLAEQGRQALELPLPEQVMTSSRFTFLGRGWAVGIAHEAALKLREAAQMWTESYFAAEVRHGPISVLDRASFVWCFGPPPAGLGPDIEATGARFFTSDLDPLAQLVLAQRAAVALARSRGLDPDHPRNLSFSVVLGGVGQRGPTAASGEGGVGGVL
jgi:fructoselysine-6-P-deglycase FrlB-like protein